MNQCCSLGGKGRLLNARKPASPPARPPKLPPPRLACLPQEASIGRSPPLSDEAMVQHLAHEAHHLAGRKRAPPSAFCSFACPC